MGGSGEGLTGHNKTKRLTREEVLDKRSTLFLSFYAFGRTWIVATGASARGVSPGRSARTG